MSLSFVFSSLILMDNDNADNQIISWRIIAYFNEIFHRFVIFHNIGWMCAFLNDRRFSRVISPIIHVILPVSFVKAIWLSLFFNKIFLTIKYKVSCFFLFIIILYTKYLYKYIITYIICLYLYLCLCLYLYIILYVYLYFLSYIDIN